MNCAHYYHRQAPPRLLKIALKGEPDKYCPGRIGKVWAPDEYYSAPIDTEERIRIRFQKKLDIFFKHRHNEHNSLLSPFYAILGVVTCCEHLLFLRQGL